MESNEAEIIALDKQIELYSSIKKEKTSRHHTIESELASFHQRKSALSVLNNTDLARPNYGSLSTASFLWGER